MNDIFNEIEKLFEGETLDFPPSTSLDKAAELSGLGKAVVLFLSDEQGAIRAVSDLEKTVAMPGFVEIASKCSDLLRQDDSCTVGGSPSSPEAFAIRLGNSSRRSILGGVGQLPEDSSDWLAENATMLRVCGELAWQAVNEESIRRKLETQVRHLRSEEETLKAAHTEASATAVEEQARRLQEEREKEA